METPKDYSGWYSRAPKGKPEEVREKLTEFNMDQLATLYSRDTEGTGRHVGSGTGIRRNLVDRWWALGMVALGMRLGTAGTCPEKLDGIPPDYDVRVRLTQHGIDVLGDIAIDIQEERWRGEG